MIIDLLDWQVGALCNLCGDQGRHAEAVLRDPDVGPVCGDCMVELLQAHRVLRDAVASEGKCHA